MTALTRVLPRLILAALAASGASGIGLTQVAAQTIPPRAERIEVVGDTVRFVIHPGRRGGSQFDDEQGTRARFGYVRSSGQWVLMNRRVAPWRLRVPDFRTKSVPLVGGWKLVEDTTKRPTRHAIRAPDGRDYTIRPSVDSSTLRAILTRTQTSEATALSGWSALSDSPQAWRFDGRTLWIATWGNWASLIAFDTVSRSMTTYTTDWVADAIVGGLAVTRRAVWLALRMPNGFQGKGLARFDRVSHRWSLVTADWLAPDPLILAMAGAGDTVWVAGTDALARYDDRSGSWDVRWLQSTPTVHEDTTEDRYGEPEIARSVRAHWQLARVRDPNETATRVIIDAANTVADVDSIESFLAVAQSLPPEHFANAYQRGRYNDDTDTRETDLGIALAHPRVLPFFLLDTLQDGRVPDDDELEAIGTLGDRSLLPYVQWASRNSTGVVRREAMVAWALSRLADSSRISVLRDYAVSYGWSGAANWSADALVELGDTMIVRRVLDLVRTEHQVWPVGWLRGHLPEDQWQALVHSAVTDSALGQVMLGYYYEYTPDSVKDDPAIRQELLQWTHAALAIVGRGPASDQPTRDVRLFAIHFAKRFRDLSAVPLIIPILTTDDDGFDRASTALFQLTAVDSVPGSPYSTASGRREVQAFWERWWGTHPSSFVVPDRAAGEAAEAAWWRKARARRR